MAFRDLFVARPRRTHLKGEALAAAAPDGAVGVFITPKSLATFPGASAGVVVIWALAKRLAPTWGASQWVPFIAAIAVGGVIFLSSVSDPDAAPKSTAQWIVAVAIGFLNSLLLAAAALGIFR